MFGVFTFNILHMRIEGFERKAEKKKERKGKLAKLVLTVHPRSLVHLYIRSNYNNWTSIIFKF